jgi:hypothetical protein
MAYSVRFATEATISNLEIATLNKKGETTMGQVKRQGNG